VILICVTATPMLAGVLSRSKLLAQHSRVAVDQCSRTRRIVIRGPWGLYLCNPHVQNRSWTEWSVLLQSRIVQNGWLLMLHTQKRAWEPWLAFPLTKGLKDMVEDLYDIVRTRRI
jgi:hypothetical protein